MNKPCPQCKSSTFLAIKKTPTGHWAIGLRCRHHGWVARGRMRFATLTLARTHVRSLSA